MGRRRTRNRHLPQRVYLDHGTYWFRPKVARLIAATLAVAFLALMAWLAVRTWWRFRDADGGGKECGIKLKIFRDGENIQRLDGVQYAQVFE